MLPCDAGSWLLLLCSCCVFVMLLFVSRCSWSSRRGTETVAHFVLFKRCESRTRCSKRVNRRKDGGAADLFKSLTGAECHSVLASMLDQEEEAQAPFNTGHLSEMSTHLNSKRVVTSPHITAANGSKLLTNSRDAEAPEAVRAEAL